MKTIDLVKDYLASEGFRYEEDELGNIHFRYKGFNLFCVNDEKDSSYLQIMIPNIYDVKEDRIKGLEVANKITRDTKVLKAVLVENQLWLSIELLLDTTPNIKDFFMRCVDILCKGYGYVAQEYLNQ